MRAVLDVNVLIAAVLSARGAPAQLLQGVRTAAFELVVSPLLLDELRRALAYPKLARLVDAQAAASYLEWLVRSAVLVSDPAAPPQVHSVDPKDDYLIALAASARCVLVSGDRDLTSLAPDVPVMTPAAFLALLDEAP